jgi:site-specific recombinase XerC
VAAFPADPTLVANYLAERGAAGQSSQTLRILVAAIKAGHEANGLAFDTKAPAITRTLRGIRNSSAKLPRQAEPMRATDVLELIGAADASPIGRRDAALLALGYVFALRRSELAALDLESQGSGEWRPQDHGEDDRDRLCPLEDLDRRSRSRRRAARRKW